MRSITILAVVVAVGMVFSCTALAAETEHLLSFQGQAADDAGDPVATGNLQVRIYDAVTEGTLVYDSDQDFNNAIQDGIFDVLLGSGTVALNLDNTVKYYLEVEINGEEVVGDTVAGRQEFWPGSGDYTHNHDTTYVNRGESGSISGGMIVDSSITSAKIVDGTISAGDILDNSITAADLAGTNCSEVCVDANSTDCASCDSRFTNEADLDHLDASDGSPANAVYVDATGKVGIGTAAPNSSLSVGGSGFPGAAIYGYSSDTGVFGQGLNGVYGKGTTFGGYFENADSAGDDYGVFAGANAAGGTNHYGGKFEASGAITNIGVWGTSTGYAGYFSNTDTTGVDYGAYAFATGAGGTSHYGGYFAASGAAGNVGVYGSGTNYAGYFENPDTAGDDYGAYGGALGTGGANHYGGYFQASGATSNTGVYGNGTQVGVYGTSSDIGVYGNGITGIYGNGSSSGGYFNNSDTSGDDHGVRGLAIGTGGTTHTGGRFEASGATGDNIGVFGAGTTHGGYFTNQDTTGNDYGAYGVANGTGGANHYGGYFQASGATGLYGNKGVVGIGTDDGVYGDGDSSGGYFTNNDITGNDHGVQGHAKGTGGTNHYGGKFVASGATSNFGVYGEGTSFGGYFKNSDITGEDYGAYGVADGAGGTEHIGGYFEASGATGNFGVMGVSETGMGVSGIGDTAVRGSGTTCDFDAVGSGTDYCATSSIRWKRNITEIDCALDKVESLQGVYFDWDDEHGGNRHDIGMIAEEVGKVVPEIVVYEEDGMYAKAMDYSKLTPLLVQAIKEQNKIIGDQNKIMEEQKGVIAQLKELVCLDHPDAEVCEQ